MKARRYYNSCVDKDGNMEKLSGKPLLDLLSQFYWNITDFDGAGQMETWRLQVICSDIDLIIAYKESRTEFTLFGSGRQHSIFYIPISIFLLDDNRKVSTQLQCWRILHLECG